MIEAIFRALARLLAGILERYADPQLEAKLEAFKARVLAADQREKDAEQLALQSEAAYQASLARRAELERKLDESAKQEQASEERLEASRSRVKTIEDENRKAHDAIDAESSAEHIRADV